MESLILKIVEALQQGSKLIEFRKQENGWEITDKNIKAYDDTPENAVTKLIEKAKELGKNNS